MSWVLRGVSLTGAMGRKAAPWSRTRVTRHGAAVSRPASIPWTVASVNQARFCVTAHAVSVPLCLNPYGIGKRAVSVLHALVTSLNCHVTQVDG